MPINRVSFSEADPFTCEDNLNRDVARMIFDQAGVELEDGEHDLTPQSWIDVYHCTLYVGKNSTRATYVGLPQCDGVGIDKEVFDMPKEREYTMLAGYDRDSEGLRLFEVIYFTP